MGQALKIAIAQMNCVVGDLSGNVDRILDFGRRARAAGAELMVTPELALCGYPPEDLLLREGFYRDCAAALADLVARAPRGLTVLVGHPHDQGSKKYNAASVVQDGRV